MLAPPLTRDEPQRIEALHALRILDTAPEERFDRVTRMARRLFDVPIAVVSLIDVKRQWFKSCTGLDVQETGRDVSFCGHAILGDGVFVIPDATNDDRFWDNPLVKGEPHIRFYAGYPIRLANGSKMGTLCIIDSKPRSFSADDAAALQDLGSMVEAELIAFQIATSDPLTSLSNRHGFMGLGLYGLASCDRGRKRATLAYFDLDDFKAINDQFGHAAGDECLVRFANGLQRVFRNADVSARMGGDEFVTLLIDTSLNEVRASAQRLAIWLEAEEQRLDLPYRTRFSCGLADYDPKEAPSLSDLVARADAAMYEVKADRKTQATAPGI